MKSLITGVTGFAGSWLADYLLEKGHEVSGTYRYRSDMKNVDHIKKEIEFYEADMTDGTGIEKVIKAVKPDHLYHLAAWSYVKSSWDNPATVLNVNTIGTLNVLEAVKKYSPKTKVQVCGSSEEYGAVKIMPITEKTPLEPLSPYAVSKVAADKLGIQYHKSYGLDIMVTRAFNHTGPRRNKVFVCSNFAKQIADKERGSKKAVIEVGNLEAKRDFTDVRDMVRGYYIVLEKGKAGEVYNLCSGKTYTIQSILDYLISQSDIDIKVDLDPKRMRPSDLPVLLGDGTKAYKELGWKPHIPLKKTLDDLLTYWRENGQKD